MLLLSASFIDKAFKYEGIVYFWKTKSIGKPQEMLRMKIQDIFYTIRPKLEYLQSEMMANNSENALQDLAIR